LIPATNRVRTSEDLLDALAINLLAKNLQVEQYLLLVVGDAAIEGAVAKLQGLANRFG
jgi:hypothetical protein